MKYDFAAERTGGRTERNETEVRYAGQYPWFAKSMATGCDYCIFQERGGSTLERVLRYGSAPEVRKAVATVIPWIKEVARTTGRDGVRMKDLKSYNVVQSRRGSGPAWIIPDVGSWRTGEPRTRLQDQLTEVLRDFNSNDCFDKVHPGLWDECRRWLLSAETDSASFRAVLDALLRRSDEELMHPRGPPPKVERLGM